MKRRIKPKHSTFILAVVLVMVLLLVHSIPSKAGGSDVVKHLNVQPFIGGNSLRLNMKVYVSCGPIDTVFSCWSNTQNLIEKLHQDNENLSVEFIGNTSSGNPRYLLSFEHPDSQKKDCFGLASNGGFKEGIFTKWSYSLLNFGESCSRNAYILFPTILIDEDELDYLDVEQWKRYPVIQLEQQGEDSEADISNFIYDFYSASPWYEVKRGEANECIVSFDASRSDHEESQYTDSIKMRCPDFSVKVERIEDTCYLMVGL